MGTNNRDRRRQKKRRQAAAERARERRQAGRRLQSVSTSGPLNLGQREVAGERVDLLIRALLRFKVLAESDAMMSVTAKIEPEVGDPLMRALMRTEAEMLLEDADLIGTPDDERRTYEQRAFDALLELVRRIFGDFDKVG